MIAWEEGVNRIADLDALPEVTDKLTLKKMSDLMPDAISTNSKVKHCQFSDRWEQYKIRFTLFDPLYEAGDTMVLVPSSMSFTDSIKMDRLNTPNQWLLSKYGGPVALWQCEMTMKNMNGDSKGQYLQSHNVAFQYSYVKRKRSGKVGASNEVIER